MKTILFIIGTRPEAIKLAPVIRASKQNGSLRTIVCLTGQHRQMVDQVLSFFEIVADHDLGLMKEGQTLFDITADAFKNLAPVFDEVHPDITVVQGDTTTVFVGALASFYKKVPVAHVEAGLRSGNRHSPFPEEVNRLLTTQIADVHFAPTETARRNLEKENIRANIHVVGNTVIDALLLGLDIVRSRGDGAFLNAFTGIDLSKKILLVTGHRRESLGSSFENMCLAIKDVALRHRDVEIVYPVHLNPAVRETVQKVISGIENIHLLEPLDYPHLIWLLNRSHLVLTDSGGIQEEAPSLGKPVLVMREVTERTEGIDAGTALLVGTSRERIAYEVTRLFGDQTAYARMARSANPYGDGHATDRILDILGRYLNAKG
jgi:UDP-N-acetylglucosamine 2-epimerase (non-hydrolysing)